MYRSANVVLNHFVSSLWSDLCAAKAGLPILAGAPVCARLSSQHQGAQADD